MVGRVARRGGRLGCFALAVVVGYLADRPLLPAFRGATVSLTTALALVSLSVLVLLRSVAPRRAVAGALAAVVAAVIAVAVLASIVSFADDRLTPLIAVRVFGRDPLALGRTAGSTALCILLLACASLPAGAGRFRPTPRGADILSAVV